MKRAHKIRLNPTPEQEQYFWRAAGVARYSFNWGLEYWNLFSDYNWRVKQAGIGDTILISGRRLRDRFCQIKPAWVSDIISSVYQGAFDDLQRAFTNFFERKKKGLLPDEYRRKDKRPVGYPDFKNKFRTTPSFYVSNSFIKIDGHLVRFDKGRVGWVNMTEALRFDGRILGGRISYQQGYWWLSLQFDIRYEIPTHAGNAVGVDLGITYLGVTSDGKEYYNPKALKQAQAKLRRLQRKLDRQRRANNPDNFNENGTAKRKVKWITSNKMRRTKRQITKLNAKIANIRQDASHKMTTEISREYAIIGVEDLNIKGMMKNHRLAQAIADAALFEKRRQLTYKAERQGGVVVPVSRWFPSSKTCNECGYLNPKLTLSIRFWKCPECGTEHHRDGNAAKNIRAEALRILYGDESPVLPGSDLNAPARTQAAGSSVAGVSTP